MLLNTHMNANIQLVMRKVLGQFSITRFFPWHLPDNSLTVNKIAHISLTCFKFPDISRFSRQMVTLTGDKHNLFSRHKKNKVSKNCTLSGWEWNQIHILLTGTECSYALSEMESHHFLWQVNEVRLSVPRTRNNFLYAIALQQSTGHTPAEQVKYVANLYSAFLPSMHTRYA